MKFFASSGWHLENYEFHVFFVCVGGGGEGELMLRIQIQGNLRMVRSSAVHSQPT